MAWLRVISTLEGDDIMLVIILGQWLAQHLDTEIGLHYRSGISHDLDGSIRFRRIRRQVILMWMVLQI